MQLGHLGDQPAIRFFREWVEEIVSAQPGLHMAHRDLLVKRCQSSSEGCGGVSLNQNQSRRKSLEIIAQALKGRTGDMRERLTRGHQTKILIRFDLKKIHDLRHHLAMLPGEHNAGIQSGTAPELLNHWSELDGFRSGAKHDGDTGPGSHRQRVSGEILSAFQAALPKHSLANSTGMAKLSKDDQDLCEPADLSTGLSNWRFAPAGASLTSRHSDQ